MQVILPNEILIEEVASLLDESRDVELMCKGSSMLPFIVGNRDSVILTKKGCDSLQVGDIALARTSPGNYVLHRVIEVHPENVILKGDGNIRGTETIRRYDILGRVVSIIGPSGRSRTPGKAVLWRHLSPFVRRCILGVYRRTILKLI